MAKKNTKQTATALVLRCCRADMSSHSGFVWPDKIGAKVVCPDWIDNTECGNGLHGWLYGQGDYSCTDYWTEAGAKWLVVEVAEADIRMIGGKCKFPRGVIRFVGEKPAAASFLIANEPRAQNVAVIGATLSVGDEQAVIVGALGTATAGDSGTATAGYSGEIRVRYWDDKNSRYRTVIGYVGEDGIEANVAYRLDDKHKLVKV